MTGKLFVIIDSVNRITNRSSRGRKMQGQAHAMSANSPACSKHTSHHYANASHYRLTRSFFPHKPLQCGFHKPTAPHIRDAPPFAGRRGLHRNETDLPRVRK
jgi:hypothetical protein